MQNDPQKLLKKHQNLIHSENKKVVSHVQRATGDWILNTVMIEGCEVPFKYKRQKPYKSLVGRRVNLTYYPHTETVAGLAFETMKVVRIKVS